MARRTVSVHPLLGPHVRLPEEPERHVWQAEVGTAAQPWLGDHQIHNVAVLPGAAYCEMALAAARTVLGEASEVRDIRFEQMLLLDERDARSAPSRRCHRRASSTSPWRPTRTANTRGGPPRSCTRPRTRTSHPRTTCPPCWPPTRAAWTAPRCASGWTSAVFSTVRRSPAWPRCTPREGTVSTVLAEVALPRADPLATERLRRASGAAGCLFPVGCGSPRRRRRSSRRWLLLPLGVRRLRAYGPARNARYCYTRVTEADAAGGRGRPRRARRARGRSC